MDVTECSYTNQDTKAFVLSFLTLTPFSFTLMNENDAFFMLYNDDD